MDKKEKNVQKHKMAVAIYREMTPEKQSEFIEENKKKHSEMCQKRQEKLDSQKVMLKKGRDFVVKNNVLLFYGSIGGYALSAGALLQTLHEGPQESIAYQVSYALCSHKDSPSKHVANGYIGWRLLEAHPYTFKILLNKSGALIPERLSQLIRLHIELDVVSKRVQVPSRLQRYVLRGQGESMLIPAPAIPKTSKKIMKKATKVSP